MDRQGAIDAAVRQTVTAWAAYCRPRDLLVRWAAALAGDDLDGVADAIVPVIQANFHRLRRHPKKIIGVCQDVARRHGGVP